MPRVDKAGLAKRVKARREAIGLSQAELAEAVGMSQQGIDNIEQAKVGRPRALPELSAVLRTTTDWLLYERGPEVVQHITPREEIDLLVNDLSPSRYDEVIGYLRDLKERVA